MACWYTEKRWLVEKGDSPLGLLSAFSSSFLALQFTQRGFFLVSHCFCGFLGLGTIWKLGRVARNPKQSFLTGRSMGRSGINQVREVHWRNWIKKKSCKRKFMYMFFEGLVRWWSVFVAVRVNGTQHWSEAEHKHNDTVGERIYIEWYWG